MFKVSDLEFKEVEKQEFFDNLYGKESASKIVDDYKYLVYKDSDDSKYNLLIYHLGHGLIARFKQLSEDETNKIMADYQENRAKEFIQENAVVAIEGIRKFDAFKYDLKEHIKNIYTKIYNYAKENNQESEHLKEKFNINPERIKDFKIIELLAPTEQLEERILVEIKVERPNFATFLVINTSWLINPDAIIESAPVEEVGQIDGISPIKIKKDDYYWNLIEQINWKKISSEGDNYTDRICDFLTSTLTKDVIDELSDFIQDKYGFLIDLMQYGSYNLKLSDDSTWDICAHVVGCGKEAFYEVAKNPSSIEKYKSEYKENFIYGFYKAMRKFDLKDE